MKIQSYKDTDKIELNRLALEAFAEFKGQYDNWSQVESKVCNMSSLSDKGEIIVARKLDTIVGAIVFVPPGLNNNPNIDNSWASIRMLVVSPEHRREGIGKHLTKLCIQKAKDIGASNIALHTSTIMEIALPMYLEMGFIKIKDVEPISGVEYSIYKLELCI